jgi:hypothetical protein
MPLTTTIFSSPDRDAGIKGGKSSWRGNHPPTLTRELIDWLKPGFVIDPMCGSGTTGDVCTQMGIPHWQSDLHQGFDASADEIPVSGDLVFSHPAYFDIVKYSGSMWGKQPDPRDLSQIADYSLFIKKLDEAHYNLFQAVRPGGYMAVLIGDVKRKGLLYPLQRDMRWFGDPIQMVIKLQHNVQSSAKSYGGNFIAIMHEYLVVTRKPKQFSNAWLLTVRLGQTKEVDQRGVERQGWRSIVWTALTTLGGRADLRSIYEQVEAHARVKQAEARNTDWQAIIRRVLQESCTPVERGTWALPA